MRPSFGEKCKSVWIFFYPFLSETIDLSVDCPENYMSGGGDCLLFDPTKRNHANTKVFCESKEKLPTVH